MENSFGRERLKSHACSLKLSEEKKRQTVFIEKKAENCRAYTALRSIFSTFSTTSKIRDTHFSRACCNRSRGRGFKRKKA